MTEQPEGRAAGAAHLQGRAVGDKRSHAVLVTLRIVWLRLSEHSRCPWFPWFSWWARENARVETC